MVYCLLHLINLYYLDSWILFFFLYTKTGANYCTQGEEHLISRTQLSFCGEVFELCSELWCSWFNWWQEEHRLRAVTWARALCMPPWPPSARIGSRHTTVTRTATVSEHGPRPAAFFPVFASVTQKLPEGLGLILLCFSSKEIDYASSKNDG